MRDMIEPTDRVLDICDRHGAKLTIMFEVAEYWAFRQAEKQGRLRLAYSPSQAMEEQARDAIRRGHDVQLHIHPQWLGAKFENGLWSLRFAQWRLADLPRGIGAKDDPLSVTGALYSGKQTLHHILRPIQPAYECIAFRAGGFCIQPETVMIPALKAAGLYGDSSVVQGLHKGSPWHFDFRTAPPNRGYWWTSADDVCRCGPDGEHILELPVRSTIQPYVGNFRLSKLRTTMKRRRIENSDRHCRAYPGVRSTLSLSDVGRRILGRHTATIDFCKLAWRSLVNVVEEAREEWAGRAKEVVMPLVMIGHSKDFWNDKQLSRFLGWLGSNRRSSEHVRSATLGEVTRQIVGKHVHDRC